LREADNEQTIARPFDFRQRLGYKRLGHRPSSNNRD
jgi:hypothetical protein